jgi:glucosyl-dolichyl phosphate glucuronosyltransferase
MNITAIIPTKNRAEILQECLTRLLPQLASKDEVIVADSSISDQTKSVVKKLSKIFPIIYIYEPRVGASYARNSAFKLAKNEGVAFLDDDSYVCNEWVSEVKRILEINKRSKPNVVYQGKMDQRYNHHGLFEKARLENFRYLLSLHGMSRSFNVISEIKYLFAANVFSYRRVFETLHGPFKADLFPFVGEDPEMAYHLIKNGYRIFYAPSVSVEHTKQRVTLFNSIYVAYLYGRAAALLKRIYFTDTEFLMNFATRKIQITIDDNTADFCNLQNNIFGKIYIKIYRYCCQTGYSLGYGVFWVYSFLFHVQ